MNLLLSRNVLLVAAGLLLVAVILDLIKGELFNALFYFALLILSLDGYRLDKQRSQDHLCVSKESRDEPVLVISIRAKVLLAVGTMCLAVAGWALIQGEIRNASFGLGLSALLLFYWRNETGAVNGHR